MNVIICSVQNSEAARLGVPAVHSLQKKPDSPFVQAWLHRAEYRLPDGYTTSVGRDGVEKIYNATGRHCPLIDSVYSGSSEGHPILIDIDQPEGKQIIHLRKVYDLTLETLKNLGGS